MIDFIITRVSVFSSAPHAVLIEQLPVWKTSKLINFFKALPLPSIVLWLLFDAMYYFYTFVA